MRAQDIQSSKHGSKQSSKTDTTAAVNAICQHTTAMNALALDSLRKAQNVAFTVTHPETGKQMEYRDLVKDPRFQDEWQLLKSNELGRLLQGIRTNEDGTQRIKGYNCCDVIHKWEVEDGKIATYCRTVCTIYLTRKRRTKLNTYYGRRKLTTIPR